MIKHIRIRKPGEFNLDYEGNEFSITLKPGSKEGSIFIRKVTGSNDIVLFGQAQGLGFYVSLKERVNKMEYAFHLSKEYAQVHAGEHGKICSPTDESNASLLELIKDYIIRPPATT